MSFWKPHSRIVCSLYNITWKWCLYASLFIFDWSIIKVASNQDRHKSSVSSVLGQIRRLILDLLALEWRKFHTFEIEYLWSQLASLDQILCVASLGWGKGCIRFWGRLTLAHWTQVSDRCPLGYLFLNIFNRQWWNFIKPCKHIDILKINIYYRKIRASGPILLELLPFVIFNGFCLCIDSAYACQLTRTTVFDEAVYYFAYTLLTHWTFAWRSLVPKKLLLTKWLCELSHFFPCLLLNRGYACA